jgi:hypothetical protein
MPDNKSGIGEGVILEHGHAMTQGHCYTFVQPTNTTHVCTKKVAAIALHGISNVEIARYESATNFQL